VPVDYWTAKNENGGYEKTKGNAKVDGEWINTPAVPVHRLCAVAWYGIDAVADADVHHRIPIPWLNIESNLAPLPAPEHAHLTMKFTDEGTPRSVVDDVTEPLGGGRR
jgi:hypothetical protein